MKKIFYKTAFIICLYYLAGCSKDASVAQPYANNNSTASVNTTKLDTGIYHLSISNWVAIPNTGVFTYDVGTLKAPAGVSILPKIYLLSDGKDIMINNAIPFMQGSIWALLKGMNVQLVYRNEMGNYLPFSSLDIRIEMQ